MRFQAPMGAVGVGRVTGIVFLALFAALAMGACGSDTSPPDARPGEPTLAAVRADIFNGSCALSSCHAPPTLAAKLDLRSDGLCSLLVGHKSCLFPDRLLVVPGKPEVSFLMDKLRGAGLDGTPDPACATSNQRMPLGQPPLSGDKLAQIEAWIQDGAKCGGDVPPAADAGIDGPGESLADVASITAVATTIHVGEQTQVTVTLTHGAPTGGQLIILDDGTPEGDPHVVSVPAYESLGAGMSSVTFDVIGQMVGTATITAASGTNSISITITVISVTFSDDKNSTTQLAGTLPVPGGQVAGSRIKNASNSNPAYGTNVDFSSTLLTVRSSR